MKHPAHQNMFADYLFSWPITRLIDKSAELDGIDTSDPKRRILAEGCSLMMSSFCAALGGPVGFVAGLLGYCIGLGAKSPNEPELSDETQDNELEYYRGAGMRAAERLGDMLSDDLRDRIGDRLIDYGRAHRNVEYTVEQVFRKVYDLIYGIDSKAANLWVVLLHDELS